MAAIVLIRPARMKPRPTTRYIRGNRQTWLPVLDDVAELRRLAAARLAPGSNDPGVVRQRSRGKLNCRERIALLLDGLRALGHSPA